MNKRELHVNKGITLIEVPYWWDYKEDSLKATIYKYCPNLVEKPPTGIPIPEELPI